MNHEDIVEVWLANGKRYIGRIVDPTHFSACVPGDDSLVLCEGGQFFVWIHRAQIRRVRAVNPRLCQFVARDTDRVA